MGEPSRLSFLLGTYFLLVSFLSRSSNLSMNHCRAKGNRTQSYNNRHNQYYILDDLHCGW